MNQIKIGKFMAVVGIVAAVAPDIRAGDFVCPKCEETSMRRSRIAR